jgi:DNA polymerase-3 subunit delta
MKIQARQVESFLRAPDPAIRAVLVYGPDTGLVREHAETLARSVVPDLTDPFLVSELSGDSVAKDPARLGDEAAAMALTGGRRVVRVRDCGDNLTRAATTMLEGPAGDSLTVLQAGELAPRSSLRRLFEAAKDAAALPCYADEARDLDRLVHSVLGAESVEVDPEAVAYLSANLGADRGVTRSELEKLAVYAGAGGRVSLSDAASVVGDSAALSVEDLVYAVADGATEDVDARLARIIQEGTSPIRILRAVSGHMLRLQVTAARVAGGEAAERAVKALRPPVFYQRARQFERQLAAWRERRLARALSLLLDAERNCKRTGMPDEAVCGRTLLQIAALARAGRRAA